MYIRPSSVVISASGDDVESGFEKAESNLDYVVTSLNDLSNVIGVSATGSIVLKSGSTMTGNLVMATGTAISLMSDPTQNTHAVRKSFMDSTLETLRSQIYNTLYPIGHVYISMGSTNPATVLGFGTWEVFSSGRVLVGHDPTQTEFNIPFKTGGTKSQSIAHTHSVGTHTHAMRDHTHLGPNHTHNTGTHILTIGQMPYHTHTVTTVGSGLHDGNNSPNVGATQAGVTGYTGGNEGHNHGATAGSNQDLTTGAMNGGAGVTGSGGTADTGVMSANDSVNNLQPYIVVHMFRRSA